MAGGIRSYSTTPGSNNSSPPYGWPEGMLPSAVNNTARQLMADIRDGFEQFPYFDWGDVPVRVDNDTFTVVTDVTARFITGRRIKLVGATTGYATITSSSYSAPDTTINVTMDSGNVPTSLTNVYLGPDTSIGAILPYFARTAAELAAGVTPTAYQYQPGDVRRYGAVIDGSTDDRTALVNAIAQGAQAGGAIVSLPQGVLAISDEISLLANVHIQGAGRALSTIRAKAGTGDAVATIFGASNINGWSIKDLTLDGNATNLTQVAAHTCVYISGCSHWIIDNIKTTDCGRTAASPSGAHILLNVWEPGDTNYTAPTYDVNSVPCRDWRISNCYLEDDAWKCEFGVRIRSDFDYNIADSAFTIFAEDGVIDNCHFSGFMWNPIELAGPGVRHNKVAHCSSRNSKAYAGFDADKGAAYNSFIDLTVHNVNVVKTDQCGYTCQGYPAGAQPERFATGNRFVNCRVSDLAGSASFLPQGIWVNGAKDTTIIGFDAKDVTTGADSFTAAVRVDNAYDTQIIGGRWENTVYGVLLGNAVIDGLLIQGIDSKPIQRFFLTTGSASQTRIRVSDCNIKVVGKIAFSVANQQIDIHDNTIYGDGTATAINISSASSDVGVYNNRIHDFNIGVDHSGGVALDVRVKGNRFYSCNTNISVSTGLRHDTRGNYATDAGGRTRTESFGTAAPVAGTWFVGDIVYHSAPAASGNIGWVCTTGGTPGTWKTFGTIAA